MTRMRSFSKAVALGAMLAAATVARADDDSERKALVRRGARLWSPYCGACHNARPAAERSPGEWDTLMMHMRVRANLPAADSRALLEFLKAR